MAVCLSCSQNRAMPSYPIPNSMIYSQLNSIKFPLFLCHGYYLFLGYKNFLFNEFCCTFEGFWGFCFVRGSGAHILKKNHTHKTYKQMINKKLLNMYLPIRCINIFFCPAFQDIRVIQASPSNNANLVGKKEHKLNGRYFKLMTCTLNTALQYFVFYLTTDNVCIKKQAKLDEGYRNQQNSS